MEWKNINASNTYEFIEAERFLVMVKKYVYENGTGLQVRCTAHNDVIVGETSEPVTVLQSLDDCCVSGCTEKCSQPIPFYVWVVIAILSVSVTVMTMVVCIIKRQKILAAPKTPIKPTHQRQGLQGEGCQTSYYATSIGTIMAPISSPMGAVSASEGPRDTPMTSEEAGGSDGRVIDDEGYQVPKYHESQSRERQRETAIPRKMRMDRRLGRLVKKVSARQSDRKAVSDVREPDGGEYELPGDREYMELGDRETTAHEYMRLQSS